MPAYVVLFREGPVHNPEEMAEYLRKGAQNDPSIFNLTPLVAYGEQVPLEGNAPDGVVILQFPTVEQAKQWYNSPGYQDAVQHRLNAADYRGVIVQGL